MTVAEVARRIRMSQSWVYKASRAGELPVVHLGAALRFEPAAIEAWLRDRGHPAASAVVLPLTPPRGRQP